ncbi:MAG: histidine kinase [Anaerolineaceae bacterium]|nr:histidine kinase [Anaerolineaceae bacterium]
MTSSTSISDKTVLTPPNRGVIIALYVFYLATAARTFTNLGGGRRLEPKFGWIFGMEVAFILLFTLVLWGRPKEGLWLNLYFVFQSALIVTMLVIAPGLDFLTMLFILIAHQIAWLVSGRKRWLWACGFGVLADGSLIFLQGLLNGLALGLVATAGIFVIIAYVIAQQEVEIARASSQAILLELQSNQLQLKEFASQVEELAGIDERSQLARELHDSVSQTLFSIQLNTRSAQLLFEKDPAQLRLQLEQLQGLTRSALADMRSIITQLREKNE